MLVPGSANPLLLRTVAAAAAGGISRSLRFNSSDSAYLSRTPASAGNRKTWTWAGWVKRCAIAFSAEQHIWGVTGTTDATYGEMFFGTGDTLRFAVGYNTTYGITTTRVFRDPGAWYHIVLAFDATQSTAANKIRLYINGVEETTFSSDTRSSLANQDWGYNNNVAHYIGRQANSDIRHFNGYLADIYFIDGQALTPSSFTETDATTGQLIPKAYTGSYGTNGFHLEFADNSAATATTLGKDTSGNGNNWTPNNLSVTAGAGNDSLVDVPTNGAQTDTGVGGEVRGNYCTLNPLESANTLSNGNLDVTSGSASWKISASTIYAQTGKWYCEFTLNAVQGYPQIGVYAAGSTFATSGLMGTSSTGYAYNSFSGNKINNNSSSAYGNSWTTGDTIGIAYDLDNGALYFSKNGTWQNSGVPTSGASKTGAAFSLPAGIFYTVAISAYGSDAGSFNFGQRQFAYTAPSGFKALCTANLPAPLVTKPSTVFDTLLWTGNGSARSITGLGFNPDLVWIKSRSAATDHELTDSVRGTTKSLSSNLTAAEATDTGGLTAFNSDGFSLGTDTKYNNNAATYAGWCWDAGSSTVTNTQGSITSSVRANASAGFSIVTYTGTGSAATVGHGLGVAPSMIIVKSRNTGATNWGVYHAGVSSTPQNSALNLDNTAAIDTQSVYWNNTAPTSTVFSVGTWGGSNGSTRTYVAYCFAPVVGYSSFGSYTGNGSSDGPFVYTGFRPRWVMIKNASASANWVIQDTARSAKNIATEYLLADNSAAEGNSDIMDITSNGFKQRNTFASNNTNGATYIYCAFAESPFNYARAR